MKLNKRVLIWVLISLTFNSLKSQNFFSGKALSISGTYGCGKIQYFFENTPTYINAADQKAVEYSPSWSFRIEKSFWLNNRFDFYFGFSHITITEKTHNTAKPPWFGFSEKNLTQGFFHFIPGLKIKLPDDKFIARLGLRLGTANFIGNTTARESSNSLGSLHADIGLESGVSIMITKKWFLEGEWIYGLTKYDYQIGMPINTISYYKYHSFQVGIRYIIHEANTE